MKRSTDPRHQARILALQDLFSRYFNVEDIPIEEISADELLEINSMKEYDLKLYDKIVDGVMEKKEEIDNLIKKYAPQWPIEQMKSVDLQILRIAIYEGFLAEITPPKVSIDEAIEIAKDFGGDISSKFVNGVLGAIYEETKKKEKKDE